MSRRPLIGAAIALGAVLASVFAASILVTPRTKGAIVTWLVEQFGGRATVGAIQWRFRPLLITADGIEVMRADASSPEPLVAIERVTIETTLGDLLASPRRVRLVRLRGLVVRIPPRQRAASAGSDRADAGAAAAARAGANAPARGYAAPEIDRVIAENARIELLSSRPEKPSLMFAVHQLSLSGVAPGMPMTFAAQLTNPKPIGEVATQGSLGPWNRLDAGATAIAGAYRFADADLSTFRGLEGTLQGEGTYSGSIAEIHAKGTAAIGGFALTGQPVDMTTRYDVTIGGTTGDVVLEPVEVAVGDSRLSSSGAIVRAREVRGRRIEMDVTTAGSAVIEDLMRIALRAEPPPISGPIELTTHLRIEPGEAPVVRRLQLDGRFTMRRARFASTDIQKTLARVSRFTGGDPVDGEGGSSVAANMSGRFTLQDGTLRLAGVSFDVPGTAVRLSGSYALESGALDLAGTVSVARSVADVVPAKAAGWIEALGRIDRRLQIDTSGTTVPITIKGTREKPVFRVDVAALKRNWRGAIGLSR